jgi:uncharacterized protein YdeI (YjbR/CyaY-like superfamily)
MERLPELYFPIREEWRNWLSENQSRQEGIWLVFYNKDAGKPTLKYNDAVEEALCFGWIDGIIKNLDQERYARKFMPRTDFFNWSETNRKRVEKLVKNGQMTSTGLNKIGDFASTGKLIWPKEKVRQEFPPFSPELLEVLKKNTVAFLNYNKMAPSHQKRYTQWVMSAKQESTRQKRMQEAIVLLEKNHKNLIK